MIKPYILIILSIAAVFLLAACGGAEPTATSNPTLTPTSIQAPTSAATETPASTDTPRSEPIATATSTATSDAGMLEVRVTARPTDAVTSSLVTVRNIEVSVSGGADEWRMVAAEPEQFDLVKLQGVEEILGSSTLEPGRYQQIRFEVTEVVLTIRGNVRMAQVPSGKLLFTGEFELVAGATTVLTLDFDAGKSIVFQPGIGPALNPDWRFQSERGDVWR